MQMTKIGMITIAIMFFIVVLYGLLRAAGKENDFRDWQD